MSLKKIGERTRSQANNADWFQYRTGRMIASLLESDKHFKFCDDFISIFQNRF